MLERRLFPWARWDTSIRVREMTRIGTQASQQHWISVGMFCLLFLVGLYLKERPQPGLFGTWYRIVGWIFVVVSPLMVLIFLLAIAFHA